MKRRIYILILFTIQLSIFRNNYGQHAIEFLQEGSHISIQESAELHLATFTLEGWIMISDTGTALITGEDSLFVIPIISRGFEDPEGESGLNYFLGLRRQDFILVADYEDTNHKNHKLSGFTSLLMNHWYHIAVTYDGSLFKLYLNGKLETMTEIPEQPLNEAIGNLGIGKMFDKNNNLHGSFVGRMDAIRIWNYARSQREILSNINSEIVTNESGLLVSLNLNEGSGTLFHSTGSLDAAMIKGASLNWTAGALFQALIPPENLEMPVLKIGLISDPQYCDYDNSTTRFYRQTLSKLVAAVDTLNNENLDFVITLGDIIDRDFVSFDSIMPLYGSLVAPTYFLLGNHDLEYVADSVKQFVREKLNMRDYYSFELGSWRFLVLDGTELAEYTVILHPELAEEGDSLRQSIAGQINDVESNGGVSKAQQLWVKQQIEEAYSKNQLVIVFCHFPVYPEPHRKNLWNNREIIDLLGKYSHVAAYINGHNHEGNYGFTDGIHYLTHSAMVETDSINSFSIVNIYPGKIVQYGYGLNHDRLLSFDNPFKMMPLPELSQNIIHYNTGVDDFIGKFNAQAISGIIKTTP
jgi:manganese-dependent ADP-ribose/CDP-alcohol diphosphatase